VLNDARCVLLVLITVLQENAFLVHKIQK